MAADVNFDDQLTVGFVRGTHGLTGQFKVESASGFYEHIETLKEVTLRHGEQVKTFRVESAEPANQTLYMKLEGINSPEEAKELIPVIRESLDRMNREDPWISDISASIGVYSAVPGEENGLDEYMTKSDREMYADKALRKQGRN